MMDHETGCEYCMPDSYNLAVLGWDQEADAICIEIEEFAVIRSDGWEIQINYCPMCGRLLNWEG